MKFFEIHILVSPSQEQELEEYVENNKEERTILFRKMTTVTSVGVNLRQPMLTFLVRKDNFEQAVQSMYQVSAKMLANKLKIVRQKVEGRQSDPDMPTSVKDTNYYEFHTKISNVTDTENWEKLARLCLPRRVPLLYNANSAKVRPVTTLRCYDMTWEQATTEQKELEALLLANGYKLEATDKEYSLFDNNVFTDQGWMFESNPKNFICHSDNPLTYQAPNNFVELAIKT